MIPIIPHPVSIYVAPRIQSAELEASLHAFIERNSEDFNISLDEVDDRVLEWVKSDVMAIMWHRDRITQIVGLVAISSSKKASSEHVGSLRLAIDKDHWGEGKGAFLMQTILENIPAKIKRLEATPYTPLSPWKYHLFIDKGGFEIEGVKKNAVKKNGDYLDVLSLVRFFE